MDPRFRRSQQSLFAAVYELAAVGPILEVSITEICRVAGLTRDTFYRHAATPADLLAQAMGEQLESVTVGSVDEAGAVRQELGFRGAERRLLEHVAEHAAVYRGAMAPRFVAQVRARLESILLEGLLAHLRAHSDRLPAELDAGNEAELRIMAGYAAAGTVGAIEEWLRSGGDDVDAGVRVILAASSPIWFATTGEATPTI